ncbi:hypothetical protein LNV75_21745, partial [Klebsiella pneumoniae]|nr:hypothetical protein [Klebsiella pneumoniae]MCJ4358252.1 hypothetical protein [Klebsiella pneumoniae]MCJ4363954.1 hypothetical protein [Klebsiella pneumoniae]MCJ4369536.1 hypothetical protein [Klebsiella pneumoniae]MCJ4375139.1 hypothetical protein [Klebsiella pneumoniae]
IGPDPRNFNQRVSLGRNDLLIRTFPNEESESYYQISCQFKFRHLDDQRRIEKILLDLILEAKRKKRI